MADTTRTTGLKGVRSGPFAARSGTGRTTMDGPKPAAWLPTAVTSHEARDTFVFAFFAVQAVACTFLQKFGYGNTPEGVVPLVLPIMLASMAVTLLFVRPVFSIERIMFYGLFIASASASTGIFASQYSLNSVGLLVLSYLPMIVAFPTSERNYRRCMNFFSNVIVVISAITILEHVTQVVISFRVWPNLNDLLPANLLIQGFNYIQPIVYGMAYMKPNAVFFLEVSFLSQFLALALSAEILMFHRTWRIVLFSAVLLSTFAGTGLLLMLLMLPVLLGRMKMRTATLTLIAIFTIALLAYYVGWYDLVAHRLNEFQHKGSSGNQRFVEPLNRIIDFASAPGAFYSGIGAGQIEKSYNFQWWPITKAIVEYGFITGILFYVFLLRTMFDNPPSRRMAFTLAVWFSIEGALLTCVNPMTIVFMSTALVVDREPRRRSGEGGDGRSSSGRARKRRSRSARTRSTDATGISESFGRVDKIESDTVAP
jgi:hypothetical protein